MGRAHSPPGTMDVAWGMGRVGVGGNYDKIPSCSPVFDRCSLSPGSVCCQVLLGLGEEGEEVGTGKKGVSDLN